MKVDNVFVEASPTLSYTNFCVMVTVGRRRYPLVYLNRPKVISEKSFCEAMEVIDIKLPDGFEFELEPEKEKGKAPVEVAKK